MRGAFVSMGLDFDDEGFELSHTFEMHPSDIVEG